MRILVVDDHAMFSESLRVLLGSTYDITTSPNGREALLEISNQCPAGILLDQDLPDIDGITLLKVINALPSPPPVLILTGCTEARLIDDARRAGAAGILHKSMPAATLMDALSKLMAGEAIWPDESNRSSIANRSDKGLVNVVAQDLGITKRQLEVLRLLTKGLPNKTIGRELHIAESTVKTHIKILFNLLKVNNRVACYHKALQLGLVEE